MTLNQHLVLRMLSELHCMRLYEKQITNVIEIFFDSDKGRNVFCRILNPGCICYFENSTKDPKYPKYLPNKPPIFDKYRELFQVKIFDVKLQLLWWYYSAIICQIIIIMSTSQIFMLTCQLLMSTCQIIMSTCQKNIITTSSKLKYLIFISC